MQQGWHDDAARKASRTRRFSTAARVWCKNNKARCGSGGDGCVAVLAMVSEGCELKPPHERQSPTREISHSKVKAQAGFSSSAGCDGWRLAGPLACCTSALWHTTVISCPAARVEQQTRTAAAVAQALRHGLAWVVSQRGAHTQQGPTRNMG
jgi:hypothetical protein